MSDLYPVGHGFDDSQDPGYPNGDSTYVWETNDSSNDSSDSSQQEDTKEDGG